MNIDEIEALVACVDGNLQRRFSKTQLGADATLFELIRRFRELHVSLKKTRDWMNYHLLMALFLVVFSTSLFVFNRNYNSFILVVGAVGLVVLAFTLGSRMSLQEQKITEAEKVFIELDDSLKKIFPCTVFSFGRDVISEADIRAKFREMEIEANKLLGDLSRLRFHHDCSDATLIEIVCHLEKIRTAYSTMFYVASGKFGLSGIPVIYIPGPEL